MNKLELLEDTNQMLDELTSDLIEFGMTKEFWAFCTFENGEKWYTNYDFILDEEPIERNEMLKGEHLDRLPAWKIYDRLEEQKKRLMAELS
ncbi:hypothetical protein ACYRFS_12980 [Listeria kieliensis]